MKITKAVIPVAGFGTRFLPITKSIPKEMLPLVDKPIVQYIVEELVNGGVKDIIFVTSAYKKAIEDYFNPHFELETTLDKNRKTKELETIKRLSSMANFVFIRQKKMAGNGDAILTAEPAVGNEPFLVYWGDEIFVSKPGRTTQIMAAFEKYQSTILGALITEDSEDGTKYGFASGPEIEPGIIKLEDIIEKPGLGKAPSPYAIFCGAYTPDIFPALRTAAEKIGNSRELCYVDGVLELIKTFPVYALGLKEARHFDCGNKFNYLKTMVEFGLNNEEFGKDFKEYLKTQVNV